MQIPPPAGPLVIWRSLDALRQRYSIPDFYDLRANQICCFHLYLDGLGLVSRWTLGLKYQQDLDLSCVRPFTCLLWQWFEDGVSSSMCRNPWDSLALNKMWGFPSVVTVPYRLWCGCKCDCRSFCCRPLLETGVKIQRKKNCKRQDQKYWESYPGHPKRDKPSAGMAKDASGPSLSCPSW